MAVRSVVTDCTPVLCTYFYRANWKGLRGRIPYMDGFTPSMQQGLSQYDIRTNRKTGAFRAGVSPRGTMVLEAIRPIEPAPKKKLRWTLGLYRPFKGWTFTSSMMPQLAAGSRMEGEQLCVQVYGDMNLGSDPFPVREEEMTNKIMFPLEYVKCATPR